MGGTQDVNSTGWIWAAKTNFTFIKLWNSPLNSHVLGEQLNYEFIEMVISRAKDKMNFFQNGNMKQATIEIIKTFRKCNLSCNVFINGELFTEYTIYNLGRGMDWANLYVGKDNKYSNYVNIRHNGLFMFLLMFKI